MFRYHTYINIYIHTPMYPDIIQPYMLLYHQISFILKCSYAFGYFTCINWPTYPDIIHIYTLRYIHIIQKYRLIDIQVSFKHFHYAHCIKIDISITPFIIHTHNAHKYPSPPQLCITPPETPYSCEVRACSQYDKSRPNI